MARTAQKLRVFSGYLKSYTTALENKPSPDRPFFKTYIDAFAGTGYRKPAKESLSKDTPLFPDLAENEPQGLLDGSASLALQTAPAFDRYVFIDRSQVRCDSLEGLKSKFPQLADRIEVQRGDANARIQAICKGVNWDSRRAVLFVDPSACSAWLHPLSVLAWARLRADLQTGHHLRIDDFTVLGEQAGPFQTSCGGDDAIRRVAVEIGRQVRHLGHHGGGNSAEPNERSGCGAAKPIPKLALELDFARRDQEADFNQTDVTDPEGLVLLELLEYLGLLFGETGTVFQPPNQDVGVQEIPYWRHSQTSSARAGSMMSPSVSTVPNNARCG